MTPRRQTPLAWAIMLAVTATSLGVAIAPNAFADTGCGPGGPPPGATSKDISGVYGQPATLWLTDLAVGITTAQGYGEAAIQSPSPLQRRALLIDAQQDGNHQIIVDFGRDAALYAVSGCSITPIVDQQGAPFRFDLGHRQGNGDGVGCSDLGDGRRLVGLLGVQDGGRMSVRRTEIDLNGMTATIGRSDTVAASSDQDPAWTTAHDISCGDRSIGQNGLEA
jgi:hypothetical protein